MKVLTLITVFVGSTVFAEPADPPAAQPLWENNAEVSALITSGNTEVTTLGLGIQSTYRPAPWTFKGAANFLNSRTSGTVTAESFSADLRGERTLYGALNAYVLANYLKNRFTGFDNRIGAEAGANFELLGGPDHVASAEVGFGAMNEDLTTGVARTFATARAGVQYKWKLSTTADFTNTLSFLENLMTLADWRLSNTAAVTAMLNDILSLKVSFKIDYLNQPVAAKSTDTTTTIALVARF